MNQNFIYSLKFDIYNSQFEEMEVNDIWIDVKHLSDLIAIHKIRINTVN